MFIDSHCHLNCLEKPEEAIKAALLAKVEHMLCVCIDLEHFNEVLQLAEAHADISASVGLHPNECAGLDPSVDELLALADNPKVIAIGETGLDYCHNKCTIDVQQQRFRRHIQAAIACSKPLIIHTRDARADTLRIMQEEGAERIGGVMHCFTEDWAMAEAAMAMGFYISFSGIVTFKNATQLQDVACKIPADKMLIETDSPYLAPVPYRGKTNTPAYVVHVAEKLAELRGESVEAIAQQTTKNFYDLFFPKL